MVDKTETLTVGPVTRGRDKGPRPLTEISVSQLTSQIELPMRVPITSHISYSSLPYRPRIACPLHKQPFGRFLLTFNLSINQS